MTNFRSLLLCLSGCIAYVFLSLAAPPLVFLSPVAAQTRPAQIENPRTSHGGWVTDKGSVLGEYTSEIEQTLESLHSETQAEVAVVVVDSLEGANEKEFAVELFKHWGVGNKRDEGVLVLHVLDTRRIEIETGYGVEGAMPDVKCGWLLDDAAVPHFKAGALGKGHAALARGLAYGIRHPEAKRDALLTAAFGEEGPPQAAHTSVEESDNSAAESFAMLLESAGTGLSITALFAVLAGFVRRAGHRSLYRIKKRKPDEFSVIMLVALSCVSVAFFLAAWAVDLHVVAWVGVVSLGALGAYFVKAAWSDFREAKRRYAPRSCSSCNVPMQLVLDTKDERYLSAGQCAEERLGTADYFVWRCKCGAIQTERYAEEREATVCAACKFHTEVRKNSKVIKAATTSATGLEQVTYECANKDCKQQRVVQEVIPKRDPPGSGGSSGGRRSSSSSSSSSSSFGGGRSGGGGAGRSY